MSKISERLEAHWRALSEIAGQLARENVKTDEEEPVAPMLRAVCRALDDVVEHVAGAGK